MTQSYADGATPLKVEFLGTGGWVPTQERSPSALVVRRGGDRLLFDAGEGVARQIRRYEISPNISHIFITSDEMDHVGGLPYLVQCLRPHGRPEDNPLRIYAPSKCTDFIKQLVTLYGDVDYNIKINGILAGDKIEFDEYSIQTFSTDTAAISLGYVLRENPRRGTFDREYADELGIPPERFQTLIDGETIELKDGTEVEPSDVLGDSKPGRKIVYTGDTRPAEATIENSADVDLLIHEAMFDETKRERAVETGHSTALEAAEVARQASAKRLVLTNISARYTGRGYVLRRDAESIFEGELLIAKDGYSIDLPYPDQDVSDYGDSSETTPVSGIHQDREDLRQQLENLRSIAEAGLLESTPLGVENLVSALDTIIERIDNSVMVLGKFHGPYENELKQISSELAKNGYDSNTATELPEYDGKSLEQNISIYLMLSKFSIMVDRDPSGHMVEYEIAKRQGTVLARLVEAGDTRQSSFMIGGREDVDINHIKSFEFEHHPRERIEDAIEWAESFISNRRKSYQEQYPWRGSESS